MSQRPLGAQWYSPETVRLVHGVTLKPMGEQPEVPDFVTMKNRNIAGHCADNGQCHVAPN